MRSRQAHSLAVCDDAEDEDDVPDERECHPELKHDEAGAFEELPVEGDMNGADSVVAVADEAARDAVHDEANNSERPKSPGQAKPLNHFNNIRELVTVILSMLKVNYVKESLHVLYKIKGMKGTVITVCIYIEVFLPSIII